MKKNVAGEGRALTTKVSHQLRLSHQLNICQSRATTGGSQLGAGTRSLETDAFIPQLIRRDMATLESGKVLRCGTLCSCSGKNSVQRGSALKHYSEEASCSKCVNRTDEDPPFCDWLKAEIPVGLVDDPECEGFTPKSLRTSKAGIGSPHTVVSHKSDDKRVGEPEPPVAKPPKTLACPKNPDKSLIQTALKIKGFNGSVVREKICCGKPGCHCQNGTLHGPYPYLHYYSRGKVKRRYLSKTVSALLSHSTKELEKMLHETNSFLGQEEKGLHG